MIKKQKLIIVGAQGHALVVRDAALKQGLWSEILLIDDEPQKKKSNFVEALVIGTLEDIEKLVATYEMVPGCGDSVKRETIQSAIDRAGASSPAIVHPSAVIGSNVTIGGGTIVLAGAIINCGSRIGRGCIINSGAIVEHDNNISDFVHLSPAAVVAGTVSVGRKSWLGVGSVVINNLSVADCVTIGAGAVVIRDIEQPGTYAGIPARRIK